MVKSYDESLWEFYYESLLLLWEYYDESLNVQLGIQR